MKEDLEKIIVEHLREDVKNFKVLTDSVNEVHSHIREDTEWKKLYAAQNEAIIAKLDVIYPEVQIEMKNKEFWRMFQTRFKLGGNWVLWIVGVIAAIVILIGYGKMILISWLGLQK